MWTLDFLKLIFSFIIFFSYNDLKRINLIPEFHCSADEAKNMLTVFAAEALPKNEVSSTRCQIASDGRVPALKIWEVWITPSL